MSNSNRLSELIELYLVEELDNDQARELLELIESDEEANRLLLANIMADFYLIQASRGQIENIATITEKKETSLCGTPLPSRRSEDGSVDKDEEERFCRIVTRTLGKSREVINEEPYDPFAIFRVEEEREKRIQQSRQKSEEVPFHWRKSFVAVSLLFIITMGFCLFLELGLQPKAMVFSVAKLEVEEFIPLARMTELVEPVWSRGGATFKRNQELSSCEVALDSGMAQILFENGAQVTLEGPVRFILTSSMETFCTAGRASVYIPPTATGFQVNTPFGKIVDHGTAFFVEVGDNSTEVQTIQGLVTVSGENGKPVQLTRNMTTTCHRSGTTKPTVITQSKYVTDEQFNRELGKYISRLEKELVQENAEKDQNPSLLARFDFSRIQNSHILNLAPRGEEGGSSLELENGELREGPLRGSKGVAFHQLESCGKFILPGKYTKLTIQANVRIDRLMNAGNVIIASDHHLQTNGAILFQVTNEGRLLFAVTDANSQCLFFDSSIILPRKKWGTWCEFKVIADSHRGEISLFCDGYMVCKKRWDTPCPLVVGSASVGNISKDQPGFTGRFLGGTMSGLAIFGEKTE